MEFDFTTAWTPATKIYLELSKKYHDIAVIFYSEEEGDGIYQLGLYYKGNVIHDDDLNPLYKKLKKKKIVIDHGWFKEEMSSFENKVGEMSDQYEEEAVKLLVNDKK